MKFVEIVASRLPTPLDSHIKPKVRIVSNYIIPSSSNGDGENDMQVLLSPTNKNANDTRDENSDVLLSPTNKNANDIRDENSDASLENTGLQQKDNIQGEISTYLFKIKEYFFLILLCLLYLSFT